MSQACSHHSKKRFVVLLAGVFFFFVMAPPVYGYCAQQAPEEGPTSTQIDVRSAKDALPSDDVFCLETARSDISSAQLIVRSSSTGDEGLTGAPETGTITYQEESERFSAADALRLRTVEAGASSSHSFLSSVVLLI